MSKFFEMGYQAAKENRPRAVDLDAEFMAAFNGNPWESEQFATARDEFYQGYDAEVLALVMKAVESSKHTKQ